MSTATRIVLLSVVALALSVPFAARVFADEPSADAVRLEPLIVTLPADPLEDSLDLLRVLVAETAPCLGCDTVLRQRPRPIALTLLEHLLLPVEPSPVDELTWLMRDAKLKDSPDLDYLPR